MLGVGDRDAKTDGLAIAPEQLVILDGCRQHPPGVDTLIKLILGIVAPTFFDAAEIGSAWWAEELVARQKAHLHQITSIRPQNHRPKLFTQSFAI